jgi:hypothetical protein
MKNVLWILAITGLLATGCGSDKTAGETTENGTAVIDTTPPEKPTLDIRLISHFVDSMQKTEGLEKIEKVDSEDPDFYLVQTGFYKNDSNFVLLEKGTSDLAGQISLLTVKNGNLIHSRHLMMRKRCSTPKDACVTENQSFYKDEKLIWSETRNNKLIFNQFPDKMGQVLFTLLDSVQFEVIPNLRTSTELYSQEIIMVKAIDARLKEVDE